MKRVDITHYNSQIIHQTSKGDKVIRKYYSDKKYFKNSLKFNQDKTLQVSITTNVLLVGMLGRGGRLHVLLGLRR